MASFTDGSPRISSNVCSTVLEPATGISGQDTAVELAKTGRKTGFLPAGTFGTTGFGKAGAEVEGGAAVSCLCFCFCFCSLEFWLSTASLLLEASEAVTATSSELGDAAVEVSLPLVFRLSSREGTVEAACVDGLAPGKLPNAAKPDFCERLTGGLELEASREASAASFP